jgi:hypothetical protein
MTTKTLDYGDQVLGYTGAGDSVIGIGSVLSQSNVYSASPVSGAPGSVHRCEISLSKFSDLYCFKDIILDFTAVNSDAVVFPTFQNVFLLLSEMRVLINNQEAFYLRDSEQLYNTIANTLRKQSEDEQYSLLQSCRGELTKTHTGESVPVSSSKVFHLPLLSFLFPQLIGYNTVSDAFEKIVFEWRMQSNFSNASLNGRFALSNNTTNSYGSNITFTNMQLRMLVDIYGDSKLYAKIPSANKIMLTPKFEVKSYAMNWSNSSETLRINLNTEFSKHSLCQYLHFYILGGTGNITAFNDTDCMKAISNYRDIGFDIRYKTKSLIKNDGVNDVIKRVKYFNDNWKGRNGFFPSPSLHDPTNGLNLYWIPMTTIDLNNVYVNEPYMEDVVAGVSNATSDFEVVFNSLTTNIGSNVTVYVALEYTEIMSIDKNGRVNLLKA